MRMSASGTLVSVCIALFLVLITLALTEVIAWSWWITAPLWIPIILVALVFLVVIFFGCWFAAKLGIG